MRLNSTHTSKKSINIYPFAVASVGFFAFTFSTLVPSYFAYLTVALCLFLSALLLVKSVYVEKKIFYFLLCFSLPFLTSLISLPFSMINEMQRFDYTQLSVLGRLVNIFVFFILILFIHQFSKSENRLLIFKWYQIGIFVLLLTALWHAVSLYTGLVSWPFETRSDLHSAYGGDYSFTDRVTGIAREPSFFVMYVVDFVALSFVFFAGVRRSIVIALACMMMILSLSPSGYVVLLSCFVLSYVFSRNYSFSARSIVQFMIYFSLFLFSVVFLLQFDNPFFTYIVNRIINADPNSSIRLFMILGPFEWVADSNISSYLFGHGMKSYSIIGTNYVLPSGEPVHVTSNNMYVDVFWEGGVLGVLLLITFFTFIFFRIFSSNYCQEQRFVTLFVFFDLLLSAFFRADYASLRFFIMLYLLFVLLNYHIDLDKKHGSLGDTWR